MVISGRLGARLGTGVRATALDGRGSPKGSSLIVQEDLPGFGTLPMRR